MKLVGNRGLDALACFRTTSGFPLKEPVRRGIRLGDSISANVMRCLSFRRNAAVLIIASISACTSNPTVRIQYIETKTYIPLPATLTEPVSAVLPLETTWGQALGIEHQAVESCNGQLKAISELKPPR